MRKNARKIYIVLITNKLFFCFLRPILIKYFTEGDLGITVSGFLPKLV